MLLSDCAPQLLVASSIDATALFSFIFRSQCCSYDSQKLYASEFGWDESLTGFVLIVLSASTHNRQSSIPLHLIAHHGIPPLQPQPNPSHGSPTRPPLESDRSTLNRLLDHHHLRSGHHSLNTICRTAFIHPKIHHPPSVVG